MNMRRYPKEFLLKRARYRCEYCHLPREFSSMGLHVDHVIAQQHRGGHGAENLAIACPVCNRNKGPCIASIDPNDFLIQPLFNPRTQTWAEHFEIRGEKIIGITPIGRATDNLLGFNSPANLTLRRHLLKFGVDFA